MGVMLGISKRKTGFRAPAPHLKGRHEATWCLEIRTGSVPSGSIPYPFTERAYPYGILTAGRLASGAMAHPTRRRIKVRGGHLGPVLCWAVVFADIGTSVYYVPGLLYGPYRGRSALFVGLTLIVFVLLTIKYAEVAWRYPEGGGVVTVASRALHPFAGLLGGLFIIVDYYLTVALSALSGLAYLSAVWPALGPYQVPASLAALLALTALNLLGIRESARLSLIFAALAGAGQLIVVGATAVSLGPEGIGDSFTRLGSGPPLTPVLVAGGYGAAFLAFSGLESIAQVAPAMSEPRRSIAGRAMVLVVVTMAVTSPLLTLWSTTLLTPRDDPTQFVSILGAHVAGPGIGVFVAVSGSLLLIFASNTAIIGGYHVFIALARMGFLPRGLEDRNRRRGTPHWSILAAISLPLGLVALSGGDQVLLGDLYAFGLLGAFVLTCFSLDVVRWNDRARRRSMRSRAGYALGLLTTALVAAAWGINLVNKPMATVFGGGLTLLGLVAGYVTWRYHQARRPAVVPIPYRHDQPIVHLLAGFQRRPAELLVILPHRTEAANAVIAAAARAAGGRPVVFAYRGQAVPDSSRELLEVADPYLKDFAAQDAFSRAERSARSSIPDRRYIYVPGNLRREVMADVWRQVHPRDTVLLDGEQDVLPPIAIDRVRRQRSDEGTVLHLIARAPLPAPLISS